MQRLFTQYKIHSRVYLNKAILQIFESLTWEKISEKQNG